MSNSSVVPLNKYAASSIIREFSVVAMIAFLLWISAGFQLWLNAWIYIIFLVIFSTVFMIAMARLNPGLLNLRGAARKAIRETPMHQFDKIFLTLFTILLFLIPIFAGLDYRGFFSVLFPLPLAVPHWLALIGFGIVVFGETLFGWAMTSNPYFHALMVIQIERGHSVISKGPYRWVRHPGYLGQILYYLGTPLLLASWWSLFLGIIMVFAFIWRTSKEDQVLMKELKGYDQYAEQTRRRLFPGLW